MTAEMLAACLMNAASTYQVPASVLIGIMKVEGGRIGQEVTNSNGSADMGPMQINTVWLPKLASLWNVDKSTAKRWVRDDGCVNINVAAWMLRNHWNESGNLAQAVAWYHSRTPGIGTRYATKVASTMRAHGLLAPPRPPAYAQPGYGYSATAQQPQRAPGIYQQPGQVVVAGGRPIAAQAAGLPAQPPVARIGEGAPDPVIQPVATQRRPVQIAGQQVPVQQASYARPAATGFAPVISTAVPQARVPAKAAPRTAAVQTTPGGADTAEAATAGVKLIRPARSVAEAGRVLNPGRDFAAKAAQRANALATDAEPDTAVGRRAGTPAKAKPVLVQPAAKAMPAKQTASKNGARRGSAKPAVAKAAAGKAARR